MIKLRSGSLGFSILAALGLLVAALSSGTTLAALAQKISGNSSNLPGYLEATKDPVSGLTFMRITKAGKLGKGIECAKDHCGHRYSSAQAWNADQSLLLIASGCSGLCFFNGQTYEPLFFRVRSGNCEWHPLNAELMICVDDRTIRLWDPRKDLDTVLFTTALHTNLEFGPGKGNPSHNGERIAVRADGPGGQKVVFVYDLRTRVKYRDIKLAQLPGENNYCTITPLGEHIACIQSLPDETQQTFILTKQGDVVQRWHENHRPGHGDITMDADGTEIMVGTSKSAPDKYQVIARRLDNGAVTQLLPYGEATHVSLRGINRNGWAIVSYEGDPEEIAAHQKWAPYGREIIAIALDGSKAVRRVAQTNNIKVDYKSETHASPSPDGSQIIWSSNWGNAGGPVYEFVTRVPWVGQ
jgi:WD40 repeat protein